MNDSSQFSNPIRGGERCPQRAALSGLRAIRSTFGIGIRIARLVVFTLLLTLPAFAQTNAFLPAASEATVTNAQGRSFRGELRGYLNSHVVLVSREGATGEITRRFNRADVQSIQFAGYELVATAADHVANARWQDAREALETLARQRGPYLEMLNPPDLGLFFALVDVRMRTGAEIDGIALARRLESLDTAADRRSELADLILTGHWQLGLVDEARTLAREWCAKAAPGGASALGWRILGEIALKEARNEDALWIALQPVAYASFENPSHLDSCYAIAVIAATRMGDVPLATRLHASLAERGLPWPAGLAEPDLAATSRLASLPSPGVSRKPDLHLRLDQVRKLIVNIPES